MAAVSTAQPPAAPQAPSGSVLAGTWTLIRVILRRDRLRIPVWIGAILLVTVSSAASLTETYPTAADRALIATTMELPAMSAMLGPNYAGIDNYTYGAMIAHQMLVMTAVVVALMSVLLLVRHTRAEEESGRSELVRASIVGRHAPAAAALTVIAAVNVALGLLIGVSLGASGIDTITWEGSLLFGMSLAAVGLVFAGVAAVTVQITEHTRGSSGLAMAAIGVAYTLRAVGDVGDGTLTWLSPIGWAQQTRSYVDDRWWPLALALTLTVLLVTAALLLSTHRDVGAGLRPPRPGSPTASNALANPFGHALRLQRASLIGWSVAAVLLGLMYGSLLGGAEDLFGELEAVQEMLPDVTGAGLTESFAGMVMTVLAMICAIQAILAVNRLRSEENAGRAEPLLSTGLSRSRWVMSHLAVAVFGGGLVVILSGLGLGVAGALSTGDVGILWQLLGAALAYVPAVWVVVGVATALFGWLPRAMAATWAVIAYSWIVVYLGGPLQFPEWADDLSPFLIVPQLPAADLTWTPLIALILLAAALTAVGVVGFDRRDIQSTA